MKPAWLLYIEAKQLPEDYKLLVRAIGLENTIKLARALPSIWAEQPPKDYKLLVRAIGLENTFKLARALPGIKISLEHPDKLFKSAKVGYILDRYEQASPEKPFNHLLLALETGLSIRQVDDIIAHK